MIEMIGLLFFLIVGICGCIYPLMQRVDRIEKKIFNKSSDMYTDGDNT